MSFFPGIRIPPSVYGTAHSNKLYNGKIPSPSALVYQSLYIQTFQSAPFCKTLWINFISSVYGTAHSNKLYNGKIPSPSALVYQSLYIQTFQSAPFCKTLWINFISHHYTISFSKLPSFLSCLQYFHRIFTNFPCF